MKWLILGVLALTLIALGFPAYLIILLMVGLHLVAEGLRQLGVRVNSGIEHQIGAVLLLVVLAFAVVLPVSAQETTNLDPPPAEIVGEEPAAPNVDEATENLLRVLFAAAIALFVDAPVTVVIVSLIKRIAALDFLNARTWATIVAVILWALLTLAQLAGYEAQFTSLLKILETTLPAIAALFFALTGTGFFYLQAVKNDAAIVSYQKPADRQ